MTRSLFLIDKVSGASSVSGSDFDPAVLRAYIQQCTAEAQEVTVARAIELKHSPGLISALAHETSQLFAKAGLSQFLFVPRLKFFLLFR